MLWQVELRPEEMTLKAAPGFVHVEPAVGGGRWLWEDTQTLTFKVCPLCISTDV